MDKKREAHHKKLREERRERKSKGVSMFFPDHTVGVAPKRKTTSSYIKKRRELGEG